MSMKYKAKFSYVIKNETNDEVKSVRYDISVDSFEVSGGAYRNINIHSTDDISISSELEQARRFKNITLYIPPTKDGTDMAVALELTNIANRPFLTRMFSPLYVALAIKKYSGRKMLEGLLLKANGALLKNPPYIVGKQLLMVEISIPTTRLYHGKTQGRSLLNFEEI